MRSLWQFLVARPAVGLGLGMVALYVLTMVVCFWPTLGADVVFLAPDAPIAPLSGKAAWQHFFASPPTLSNLLFCLFPYSFAYEGTFWVDSGVMCCAGLLCLRSRGYSWGAAWVGGFCVAFMGYFFTLFCAGHRGVVDALAVTCLGFWLVTRLVQHPHWKWSLGLAVVFALGLAAQADVWALVMVVLGAYTLVYGLEQRAQAKRIVLHLALAGIFFGIVGFPALCHTFGVAQETRSVQLSQAEEKGKTATEFVTDWSLPPEDLIELAVPDIHGRTSYPFDPNPYTGRMGTEVYAFRQHSIHMGILTLLLAGCALLRAQKGRWFWLGAAGVTLVLALGKYTPLYQGVLALPVLSAIRAPVKWLHLTGFAVAMLAGMGAEGWIKRFGTKVAFLFCALIALNGAWVARGYLFAQSLALESHPLTAALPADAILYNAEGGRGIDAICRWNEISLTSNLTEANCIILDLRRVFQLNPNLRPLAAAEVQGRPLALYPYPIPSGN